MKKRDEKNAENIKERRRTRKDNRGNGISKGKTNASWRK
jgi:hypothetical protein